MNKPFTKTEQHLSAIIGSLVFPIGDVSSMLRNGKLVIGKMDCKTFNSLPSELLLAKVLDPALLLKYKWNNRLHVTAAFV